MTRPIFFDASGKRRKWMLRAIFALLLVIAGAAVVLGASIVAVPVPDPLPLRMERPQPRPLPAQIAKIRHSLSGGMTKAERKLGWLPRTPAPRGADDPVVSAFYVPWDDGSRASLQRNIKQLDWVIPGLSTVTGPKHDFHYRHDPIFTRIVNNQMQRPKVLPMLQNAANGGWDGKGAAAMFADPAARKAVLDQTAQMLAAEHAAGVVFDFEDLPAYAHRGYQRFLSEARARFNPQGLLVTATVPVGDPEWNLAAYARVADRLFIMNYDEHYMGGEPGPIASQPWFVEQLRASVKAIGPAKAIMAIGSYAYDWHGDADALSVEEAWLAAHDSDATIKFDQASGNATFSYEEGGVAHHVWILDAASAWNQLRATRMAGVGGISLWRLGSEDPGIWPVIAAYGKAQAPDISDVVPVGNVDIEGNGEILHIDSVPTDGKRAITFDQRGLISDEVFSKLPTPYVVRRTGYIPGKIALTFDDGPDGEWTPKILDILKQKGVPGTFFLIGENAMAHPALINRIIDQGSEIGSHSYTHPNLALESARGTRIELNATQRLIQAYTGRSVRLFRAPYFGDAEPTTADELVPAWLAQQAGYVNVGLHVDSEDWQRPGTDAIVNNAVSGVEAGDEDRSGQIILLHDGGGDRAETVEALPRIIDQLKARGYQFVTVSALAGLTPQQAMPAVAGADLVAVRADIGIFLVIAGLLWLLKWLFFVAITLGIGRAVLIAALAVRSNAKANRPVPPAIDPDRFVSVIIPAFNEARVIEASVNRVLASTEVKLEVIVVDDGSTDGTSDIVARAFSADPRVRLLTLQNGGKAHALNQALKLANGDIIVALDADTQFEPETIARLARWFADDRIGAVAGNAKVGNRINLATRWQAVEYVTAQNLERRALDRFDAITVVPGAVGAWRRKALDDVGGYPVDTLAEDQDLTIAIQRKGWLVSYDVDAVAWTEAPETLRALAKQRFRWAFGTLQCLWKHRSILRTRKPAGLALVGIPQAWLFQIIFALISPVIDLALVTSAISTAIKVNQHGWAQTHSDLLRMAVYWLAFTAIDVVCGWIAYRLEPREKRFPVGLLLAQRFVYRQLMYSVVIRAVGAAMSGPWVGWGKLERSGKVAATQQ
ncbi:MAG: polysaccharide deacetylase [Sphingomonas sanxanigenens]|uniref:Chitooligosaccharide deacetylase n=1 Tax=Sphingomonas sanxanigenens TaxID=397260 RepID=A0A2W5A840_9SPHN|nr:MAG: polysaccharide deacetylase [Sphingomonas sanxanigenens]